MSEREKRRKHGCVCERKKESMVICLRERKENMIVCVREKKEQSMVACVSDGVVA